MLGKFVTFGIIFALCISGIPNCSLHQISISNSEYTGNIIIVDDDGTGDYIRIQDAIDNANEGDIIKVYPGIYKESISVYKRLNILGEGSQNTFIIGNKTLPVVTIESNNIIFSGFTIKNGTNGIKLTAVTNIEIKKSHITNNNNGGINASSSSNINIFHNNISNNVHYWNFPLGIKMRGCKNIVIKNNSLIRNCGGIKIYSSTNITTENNLIAKSYEKAGTNPFCLTNCQNSIIRNNTIRHWISNGFSSCINTIVENNDFKNGIIIYHSTQFSIRDNKLRSSLTLYNSSYIIVEKNGITSKYEGCILNKASQIQIYQNNISNNKDGIILQNVNDSTINENTINDNEFYGIWIDTDCTQNLIDKNSIAKNGNDGIYCWGSCNIIRENIITQNMDYGINLPYSAHNNKIYCNNFIQNQKHAYVVSKNIWDNDKKGNYWDDYLGLVFPNIADPDENGIGNIPYNIPGGIRHRDKYPLMNPLGQIKKMPTITLGVQIYYNASLFIFSTIYSVTTYDKTAIVLKDNGGFFIPGPFLVFNESEIQEFTLYGGWRNSKVEIYGFDGFIRYKNLWTIIIGKCKEIKITTYR